MKLLPFIFLVITCVLSAYHDSDIDGVEDSIDQCSYTPFDEVVDEFGCSKNSHVGLWTFKIGTEIGFDTIDNKSRNYNFSIDYIVNHWSIGISNSSYIGYYENNKTTREMGDIYTYVGYEVANEIFSTIVTLGTKIAIANESVSTGENDYYVNVQLESRFSESYMKLFSTSVYTFTGDTNNIAYKDIFSYNIGVGYSINTAYYTSLSYENSQSIYKNTENYQALVWTNRYMYNDTYFVELDYTRGIDAFSYDHLFSFKVGATFE